MPIDLRNQPVPERSKTMSLNHMQVPIPRLRQQTGGIALLLILAIVVVLSAVELKEQVYLMSWMKDHDMGYSGGFSVRFDSESLKISWLPTLLYRSPHHQLAVAASMVNIVTSVLVMGLFFISCRIQKVSYHSLTLNDTLYHLRGVYRRANVLI